MALMKEPRMTNIRMRKMLSVSRIAREKVGRTRKAVMSALKATEMRPGSLPPNMATRMTAAVKKVKKGVRVTSLTRRVASATEGSAGAAGAA
jgi:hypothetical protein